METEYIMRKHRELMYIPLKQVELLKQLTYIVKCNRIKIITKLSFSLGQRERYNRNLFVCSCSKYTP